MATIRDLKSLTRRVLTPSIQHRRIAHETTDVSVPLDHDPNERLPLEVHRAYGVGASDDRLMIVNLRTGDIGHLPSRSSLLRAEPNALNMAWYRYAGRKGYTNMIVGKQSLGSDTLSTAASDQVTTTGEYDNMDSDTDPFALFGRHGTTAGNNNVGYIPCGWQSVNSHDFARAFVTGGHDSQRAGNLTPDSGLSVVNFIHPHTFEDGTANPIDLQLEQLVNGITADDIVATSPQLRRSLIYLYNTIPTTKSDFINGWLDVLMSMPSNLQYIENALYNLYGRNRSTRFPRAVGEDGLVQCMLSMIELGRAIRLGRPLRNIVPFEELQSITTDSRMPLSGGFDGTAIQVNGSNISGGTINAFYQLLEANGDSYLIAPSWLSPLLNFGTFESDLRDEEMPDVERSDIIQAINLLFEGAEVESALDLGTKKHVLLALFEKIAEGEMKDFTEYTSPSTALATSLLGYVSARDIVDRRPQPTDGGSPGRVPYFGQLLNTSGRLIGRERLEFLDNLEEFKALDFKTASPQSFTETLSRTANWSNTTMYHRTRFGDHAVTKKWYPGCFSKTTVLGTWVVQSETSVVTDRTTAAAWNSAYGSSGDNFAISNLADLHTSTIHNRHLVQAEILVPFYGWNMLDHATCTAGLVPVGMADNAILSARGNHRMSDVDEGDLSDAMHEALWTIDDWRLSTGHHLYRKHVQRDELYKEWSDRASTIRNKDASNLVTFSSVNFFSELTMNTPPAIVQRNMPTLVRIMEQPFQSHTGVGNYVVLGGVHVRNAAIYGALDRCHPFTMNEDRELFNLNSDIQARDTGFDLLTPMFIDKPVEDIQGIYQALVYLASETDTFDGFPAIARAQYGTIIGTPGKRMINQELVIYQSKKDFEGRVTDVGCEFITCGVDASIDGSEAYNASTNSMTMLFHSSETVSTGVSTARHHRNKFSLWNWRPGPSEEVSNNDTDYAANPESAIFLTTAPAPLSGAVARSKVRLPGTIDEYHVYNAVETQSEAAHSSEFALCGEHWSLRAFRFGEAAFPGHFSMCDLFREDTAFLTLGGAVTNSHTVDATGTGSGVRINMSGNLAAGDKEIVVDTVDATTVFSVGDTLYGSDGSELFRLGKITSLTATTIEISDGVLHGLNDNMYLFTAPYDVLFNGVRVAGNSVTQLDIYTFMDQYGRYIESVRDDLEWQHAGHHLLFLDADINDETEFKLNRALYGTGNGTRGPLTLYMVLDATGKSVEAASIVGDMAIEVIDLSLGTSSEVSTDTDVDDIGAGEENPSMEIVSEPEA